ncbi:MAG: peroxiredoxin [Rickettsiaceae bacterium]
MTVFIGKEASDFTTKAIMPDNSISNNFHLRQYIKGCYGVIFFYPLNFTFVCPSEIIAFNNRIGEFTEKNAKIIAVSVDSHFSHLAWKNTRHEDGGVGNVQIPMISDIKKQIASDYNVLTEDGVSLRGTFIIDNNFVLRHIYINDLPIGRNVDETLRVIDAIQFHDLHGDVCPAGWAKGKDAMNPSSKGVADYLASNAEDL